MVRTTRLGKANRHDFRVKYICVQMKPYIFCATEMFKLWLGQSLLKSLFQDGMVLIGGGLTRP
jgi:hypothetical protein